MQRMSLCRWHLAARWERWITEEEKTRMVRLVLEEENFDYKFYGSQNAKCVCGIVDSKVAIRKLLAVLKVYAV